jgi:hypothetical protein
MIWENNSSEISALDDIRISIRIMIPFSKLFFGITCMLEQCTLIFTAPTKKVQAPGLLQCIEYLYFLSVTLSDVLPARLGQGIFSRSFEQ